MSSRAVSCPSRCTTTTSAGSWVYVQYLKADGTNLSARPHRRRSRTPAYAQSLGCSRRSSPCSASRSGTPTRSTSPSTSPPRRPAPGCCSAGSATTPSTAAGASTSPPTPTPGQIAPQDEVLFPALVTGILTIGLTGFALLTDLDIATTWAAIRGDHRADDIRDMAAGRSTGCSADRRPSPLRRRSPRRWRPAGRRTRTSPTTAAARRTSGASSLDLGAIIPKVIFNPAAARLWIEHRRRDRRHGGGRQGHRRHPDHRRGGRGDRGGG